VTATPPQKAIDAAIAASKMSGCGKSQRGVAIFKRYTRPDAELMIIASNWNRPPHPFTCDKSEMCRRDCAKICSHAEQTAVATALVGNGGAYLRGFSLVHVKTVNGELVPSGGPSCWQCSRLILEVEIEGVWLYEEVGAMVLSMGDGDVQSAKVGGWRHYTAVEFHFATLRACEIHVGGST
jgi:deoxycytidylate deaminase